MRQPWDQISTKLKHVGGEVNKHWGRLTDEELLKTMRRRTVLVDKILKRYGHRERKTSQTG